MDALAALVASPIFLLGIMGAVLVEAAALIVWHRRTGRGPRPLATVSFLGAGLAFLGALYVLRAHQSPSLAFLSALTLALVFHVWHLVILARR
ncbi:MAG: hypothetical protein MUD17_01685 [Gemmatimonadaceae bacterium]|jgi:hypothetical protein|nr:hypothetical protein [Gemmatimonadaceae bacterium]